MRRFIVLLICSICWAFPVRGQSPSETVYLIDGAGTGSGGYGNTINPYPGLGTNAMTGESCVHPYSDWQNDAYSTGYQQQYAIPATTIPAESTLVGSYGSPILPWHHGGDLYLSHFPAEKRSGIFQKLNANGVWAPKRGGDSALGLVQFDLSASFAIPMLKPESPLIVTPLFEGWFFKGKGDDSWDKFYTTGIDTRWIRPVVKDKFTIDLGGSLLYSGTFHGKAKKAMRYPAHFAGIWNANPRLQVVLGVSYLDRNDDYNWFPMAGIIWKPNEDLNFELVTPRLRIAQRIRWFGSAAGDDRSDWIYCAYEFAGGSWTEYEDGFKSSLDYKDMRLLLGYERRTAFGLTLGFEVGYMFKRKLELHGSYGSEFQAFGKGDASDCVFLRVRTSY